MNINMTDPEYVKTLKQDMHVLFDTPSGEEIMRFLEMTCCWYQSVFNSDSPDMTLINDGKRQVIATIKTILTLSPEQIVELARMKEG